MIMELVKYRHDLAVVPYGRHDDQLDATPQFLDWFKSVGREDGNLPLLPGAVRGTAAAPPRGFRPAGMSPGRTRFPFPALADHSASVDPGRLRAYILRRATRAGQLRAESGHCPSR
jgi:hypothetical protein